MHGRKDLPFHCLLCSYSSKRQNYVDNHLKRDHRIKAKKKQQQPLSARVQVMRQKIEIEEEALAAHRAKRRGVLRRLVELTQKKRTAKLNIRNLRSLAGRAKVPTPAMRKALGDAQEDLELARSKLNALQNENMQLIEEIRIAEESRVGADQVLRNLLANESQC